VVYSVKDFALHAKMGGECMFEKDLRVAALLDCYGSLLSERHRELLDYYYNEDLSLGEIAAEVGISRQGVRDGIKKAEEELGFFEERLSLLKKEREIAEAGVRVLELTGDNASLRAAVLELLTLAGAVLPDQK